MTTPFKAELNGVTADRYAGWMTRLAGRQLRQLEPAAIVEAVEVHGKRWETLDKLGIDTVALLVALNTRTGVGTDWADPQLQKFLDVAMRKVEHKVFEIYLTPAAVAA